MRTAYRRSLLIAAVAIVALASNGVAQERPSGLLNSVEVRQLVARAEPADHARLRSHFTALSGQYAAEAKRHISMSQSFGLNPNRTLGTGVSMHCKRLAELATASAATVRELAAYHDKLSAGTAATLPSGGPRFERGAGAPAPTEQELNALAAKASTPAAHRALEEYFLTLANRYAAAAEEHVALAQMYRGTRLAPAAVHQDHLAALARDEAKEANRAAEQHKEFARVAR